MNEFSKYLKSIRNQLFYYILKNKFLVKGNIFLKNVLGFKFNIGKNFRADNYRFWFYRQLARPHNHIEKGSQQNGTPQRIHMHVCHGLHLFPIDFPPVFGVCF